MYVCCKYLGKKMKRWSLLVRKPELVSESLRVIVGYWKSVGIFLFAEPPRDEPKITGEEKIYATGDILALNCTSGFSYPAARLQWFINNVPVSPTFCPQSVNCSILCVSFPHFLSNNILFHIFVKCRSLRIARRIFWITFNKKAIVLYSVIFWVIFHFIRDI
jgi:hypothetical protein